MAQVMKTATLVTIDAAGTAEAVVSGATYVTSVIIEASSTNAGTGYIGDSTVTSSNGVTLGAGDTWSWDATDQHGELDLSTVYLDTDNSGDTFRVIYTKSGN